MNGRCPHCLEPIAPGEKTLATDCGQVLYHRECLLRMVVGSVGHLVGRCSCFGGSEDDPPGMTAARRRSRPWRSSCPSISRCRATSPASPCPRSKAPPPRRELAPRPGSRRLRIAGRPGTFPPMLFDDGTGDLRGPERMRWARRATRARSRSRAGRQADRAGYRRAVQLLYAIAHELGTSKQLLCERMLEQGVARFAEKDPLLRGLFAELRVLGEKEAAA